MKNLANLSIIRDLLFTYSIENTKDLCREEIIVSKKINNTEEPSELFDALTKPEFTSYTKDDRDWLIKTLEFPTTSFTYLKHKGLLDCLVRYGKERFRLSMVNSF